MSNAVIKQIPNALTTLRIFLAIPVFLLIIEENYPLVLWVALIAGLSDGVDGWLARKLDAMSRFGAIADPLSDKALLISAYLGFVVVGLLPWWVAFIVALRDGIIVSGALVYHWLFGRYDMSPSILGKASTFVQIAFALVLLMQQVYPLFPEVFLQIGIWMLVLMAVASGSHYVYIWGNKALKQRSV